MGSFRLQFWCAAQIHHFLHSIPNPQKFNRQLTTFEEYCSGVNPLPRVLSKTYELLNTPPEQPQLPCLIKWEKDLYTVSKTKHDKILPQIITVHQNPRDKLQNTDKMVFDA